MKPYLIVIIIAIISLLFMVGCGNTQLPSTTEYNIGYTAGYSAGYAKGFADGIASANKTMDITIK